MKVVVKAYPHPRRGAWPRSAQRRPKGDPPDLFLMDHDDLAGLTADKAVRRVDDLLADREVDFGDGYTRNVARGVQRRLRPAVHADRRLAAGRLLQHPS